LQDGKPHRQGSSCLPHQAGARTGLAPFVEHLERMVNRGQSPHHGNTTEAPEPSVILVRLRDAIDGIHRHGCRETLLLGPLSIDPLLHGTPQDYLQASWGKRWPVTCGRCGAEHAGRVMDSGDTRCTDLFHRPSFTNGLDVAGSDHTEVENLVAATDWRRAWPTIHPGLRRVVALAHSITRGQVSGPTVDA
jgi:hypothetical protein